MLFQAVREILPFDEIEIRQLLAFGLTPRKMVPVAAAAIAALIRARILLVAIATAAAALASAWIWLIGRAIEAQPLEACIAILLLGGLSILNVVFILVGGRAAFPQVWALILTVRFIVILIVPLRALAKGAGLLPGARASHAPLATPLTGVA